MKAEVTEEGVNLNLGSCAWMKGGFNAGVLE